VPVIASDTQKQPSARHSVKLPAPFAECETDMHPTHRTSYGRSRRRRSHLAIKSDVPGSCPLTALPKQHHRACPESGYVRPGLRITIRKYGIGLDD